MGLILLGCVLVNIPYTLKGYVFNGFACGVSLMSAIVEISQNGLLG